MVIDAHFIGLRAGKEFEMKSFLFMDDCMLSLLSLWIPMILVMVISGKNLWEESGVKKLLVFYLSLFASVLASMFGNAFEGAPGGVITGGVIGILAGGYAGEFASRKPLGESFLLFYFFVGGIAGGMMGTFTSSVVEAGMALHYIQLLLIVMVVSFILAKFVIRITEWAFKDIGVAM